MLRPRRGRIPGGNSPHGALEPRSLPREWGAASGLRLLPSTACAVPYKGIYRCAPRFTRGALCYRVRDPRGSAPPLPSKCRYVSGYCPAYLASRVLPSQCPSAPWALGTFIVLFLFVFCLRVLFSWCCSSYSPSLFLFFFLYSSPLPLCRRFSAPQGSSQPATLAAVLPLGRTEDRTRGTLWVPDCQSLWDSGPKPPLCGGSDSVAGWLEESSSGHSG